jgi:hypothetical protein
MTFHIGNQTAGVVNNVAGDQRITGGQQGILVSPGEARQAVQDLRGAMSTVSFDDEATAAAARKHLETIDAEVQAPQPDRSRVARALEPLTRLLVAAGSLATAGATLIAPLHTLASWLGDLGRPILALLPALA